MADQSRESAAVARTGMLIRRPVADVFAAFADPAITSRFWFTRGSAALAAGRRVTWSWEMYDASADVLVTAFEPDHRIEIEWDGYGGRTRVGWTFASLPEGTFVAISESGWTGDAAELLGYVRESTGGFTWMLAGAKAWLEHGVQLNLVGDRFPRGPQDPYPVA